MIVLSASNLALSYGAVEIFSGINLEVLDRAKIGIVGPNGGGKTSLLEILVGHLEPDAGRVHHHHGIRLAYVPQFPTFSTNGTLRDEIMTAFADLRRLEDDLDSSALAIKEEAELGEHTRAEDRYASLMDQYEAGGGYTYLTRMEQMAAGLGLSAECLASPAESASGGENTRAALVRALLSSPDLLVLDEPTNHLDLHGLAWLEQFLSHYPHAFLVVSHDRYFLDRVVTQVCELDRGRLQTFRGNYTKYRALKKEQMLLQAKQYHRQQEFVAKEEDFIRRYKAGQRAREAKGRDRRLERLERLEAPVRDSTIAMTRISAGRTERVVVRTENLIVGFKAEETDQDNTQSNAIELFTVPDITLERGSRTAIIGDNGIGKSTLLKTILGLMPALSGSVTVADSVKVGYFSQDLDSLDESSTVLDSLLDVKNMPLGEARSYLARFLFQGEDVFQQVSSLSGGERSRLVLACILITEPSLLVMDEPTTHLDIPSREALEQVLLAFDGTTLLVSHDRQLISMMAQNLWIVEDGRLTAFPGTFEEWMRQTPVEETPPSKAAESHLKREPAAVTVTRKNPQVAAAQALALEQAINQLEARLDEIEGQLQAAAENQDVAALSVLGEDYESTRLQLDQKWDEWTS